MELILIIIIAILIMKIFIDRSERNRNATVTNGQKALPIVGYCGA